MRIEAKWMIGAFGAVLLLGACSSRNPDSLVGMNLDANAAAMNADVSADAMAAVADAPTNAVASPADTTAVKAEAREPQRQDRPAEVDAAEPEPAAAPDEEPSIANQPEGPDDPGNAD